MAAILDFWIFPNLQERAKIEQKVIKTIGGTLIWAKNVNVREEKRFYFLLERDFLFSEKKGAGQKLVAMVTWKSINTNWPHQTAQA